MTDKPDPCCVCARVPTAALTVRWLSRPPGPGSSSSSSSTTDAGGRGGGGGGGGGPRLVVCTGERMEALVGKLYRSFGLRATDYEPTHARGLSNEFYCYANFECGEWKWRR